MYSLSYLNKRKADVKDSFLKAEDKWEINKSIYSKAERFMRD